MGQMPPYTLVETCVIFLTFFELGIIMILVLYPDSPQKIETSIFGTGEKVVKVLVE